MVREGRTVEVRINSATDVKRVKKFGGDQKCYAVAYIYPTQKQTTSADHHGGINPTWNATLQLTCYEIGAVASSSPPSSQNVTVEVYNQSGRIFHSSDKLVGTVTIPLKNVAADANATGALRTYEVRLPSREVQSTLELSVKLGDKRELREGEEDFTAALHPSLPSSQEGQSSIGFVTSDKLPTSEPACRTSTGQSTYGDPAETDNSTKHTASVTEGTFAETNDGIGTKFPVRRFAYASLGELPVEKQSEGLERSSHGPEAARLPDTTGQQRPRKPIRGGIRSREEQRSRGQGNGEHGIDGFPGRRNSIVRGGLIVVGGVFQIFAAAAAGL